MRVIGLRELVFGICSIGIDQAQCTQSRRTLYRAQWARVSFITFTLPPSRRFVNLVSEARQRSSRAVCELHLQTKWRKLGASRGITSVRSLRGIYSVPITAEFRCSMELYWVITTQQQQYKMGVKRDAIDSQAGERPQKKSKILLSDDGSSDNDERSASGHYEGQGTSSGDQYAENIITVNQEYARRFEHNKKREERQRRGWNLLLRYVEATDPCSGGEAWQSFSEYRWIRGQCI